METANFIPVRTDTVNMKLSWCVLVLAAVTFASGCSTPAEPPRLPGAAPPAPRVVRVQVTEAGISRVRVVALEDYVRATVISEFAPASGDPDVVERMLEVQAVISRTYALAHLVRHGREGFDLCSTTHCQLFEPSRLRSSRWAGAAGEATERTAGEVLWYDGAPASALFHADCGGHTSNSQDVWGGTGHPYLIGITDDGPAEEAHAAWRYEATVASVRRALDADRRTGVGVRLDGLTVLDRDSAGRVERIAVSGARDRIVRGEELRDVLSGAFGPRAIRSTLFTVRRQRSTFVFEGRGFGHGVGLCQAGALACVRAGHRLPSILQRYFPGTKLTTLQ